MKKIYSTIAAAVASLAFTACSSDYLDQKPTEYVEPNQIFTTADNAKSAINGLAKIMTTQYLSSQGKSGEGTIIYYYGNCMGNDFSVTNRDGWYTLWNTSDICNNNTNMYSYYPWYYYYKLIANANFVINSIGDTEGEENVKAYYKAQALTFRAYAYMQLAQFYCKRWADSNNGASRGLVLRTAITDSEVVNDMAASTLAETFKFIYDDLDEAIAGFSGKPSSLGRSSDERYLPSLEVAYAVKARAASVKGDWDIVADCAQKARSGYKLMTDDNMLKGGFSTVNDEWIWSVYGATDETLYYYELFALMGSNSSASWCRNYPSAISRELYNKIPSTDVRRELWIEPTDDELAGTAISKTTMLATTSSAFHKRAHADFSDKLYSTSRTAPWMQVKFQNIAQPGVGNICVIRAAEMLLLEAEAQANLGNDAAAQALLKELNQERDEAYDCTSTGDELLEEVRFYTRLELWGEGKNWFDYKRWNLPIERKSYADGGNFTSPRTATTINTSDANAWTFVYPERETNYNKLVKTRED